LPSTSIAKDYLPTIRGGNQSIFTATIIPVNESDSQNTSDTLWEWGTVDIKWRQLLERWVGKIEHSSFPQPDFNNCFLLSFHSCTLAQKNTVLPKIKLA
jgi:hypothetical protein